MPRLRIPLPILPALALLLASAPAEEPNRPGSFLIRGARLVVVSGPVIEHGDLLIRDGLIAAVGSDIEAPADAWVIEGEGLTLYPGWIDSLTSVGIPSPGKSEGSSGDSAQRRALPLSRGPRDRPGSTPWRTAADLVDPADKRLKQWRNAGFTTAIVVPSGGIVAGQASAINLAPEYPREMVVEARLALALDLSDRQRGYRGFPVSLMGRIAYLKQFFLDVEDYRRRRRLYRQNPVGLKRPAYDRALAPIQALLDEGLPALYPADSAVELNRAVRFRSESGVALIAYGARGGYRVAERLAESKTPVLVNLDWPKKDKDADPEREPSLETLRFRDRAPSTPAALEKAGVRFAFYSGNLKKPSEAIAALRKAVEKGLSEEAALSALTLGAAGIYGLDDRLGSLEEGKIANLVVTDGAFLDKKSKIKMVFVDGRKYDPPPEREENNEKNDTEEEEGKEGPQ